MKRFVSVAAVLWFVAVGGLSAGEQEAAVVPEGKQTVLGLYVTAQEAFQRWKADPDKVTLIDVRTPEEYVFVGHPDMAYNVPLKLCTRNLDPKTGQPVMRSNRKFGEQVKRIAGPDDTIMVFCRSGHRSAQATNILAELGFRNVFSILDGFEGDVDDDPDSPTQGKRTVNGWKNAGATWTYKVDPKRMSMAHPDQPAKGESSGAD